jgi:hypothetical protein
MHDCAPHEGDAEHAPEVHNWPIIAQSVHVAPLVPQALSEVPPAHVPFASQQPAHFGGPHAPASLRDMPPSCPLLASSLEFWPLSTSMRLVSRASPLSRPMSWLWLPSSAAASTPSPPAGPRRSFGGAPPHAPKAPSSAQVAIPERAVDPATLMLPMPPQPLQSGLGLAYAPAESRCRAKLLQKRE